MTTARTAAATTTTTLPHLKLTLTRENDDFATLVRYAGFFVLTDTMRQLSAFGLSHHNGDAYPIAPTALVLGAELLKLAIFAVRFRHQITSFKPCARYALPAFLYAVNNNVYYEALRFTTPPMWNVLMQMRTIFTAIIYRVVFHRRFTYVQIAGLLLMCIAIALVRLSVHGDNPDENQRLLVAIGLALVASLIAAAGPVYTEYLLKNDDRTFTEKQVQLYLFGSMAAGGMYAIHHKVTHTPHVRYIQINGHVVVIVALLVTTVLLFVVVGVCTAFIMKTLDNIVKLYTQSLSTIVMAIASFILFPRICRFHSVFVVSLCFTIVAIFLYEHQYFPDDFAPRCQAALIAIYSQKLAIMLCILTITAFSVLLILYWNRLKLFNFNYL